MVQLAGNSRKRGAVNRKERMKGRPGEDNKKKRKRKKKQKRRKLGHRMDGLQKVRKATSISPSECMSPLLILVLLTLPSFHSLLLLLQQAIASSICNKK
jgi:hypothetical protein